MRRRSSKKAAQFQESVIREMTRLAHRHDAVNLAQGYPDFDPPPEILEAACTALRSSYNQYSVTWGAPELRRSIAEQYRRVYGMDLDPDRNIVVCCGATESMLSAMLALVDPGDEVIIFEPFYENYGPDAILCGAVPRYAALHPPRWEIDWDQLDRLFSPRTRAVILNTPNNPTGRVLRHDELKALAERCQHYDVYVLTDEIYEYITYDTVHTPMATLPGMFERTLTISGASKTFSATGWRVGWVIGPQDLIAAVKKTHDFVTVGAPHPLQLAVAAALRLEQGYFESLARMYREKRDRMAAVLSELGFRFTVPEGAYYILADFHNISDQTDVAFARWLVTNARVAVVPGSSFYHRPERGRHQVRFNFCKRDETLELAFQRLQAALHGLNG